MRFCLVCAQATRFLCQMWTGMEQWVNGLAALLGLQGSCGSHSNPLSTLYSGQEGLGQGCLWPREHLCPSQATFSASALELQPTLSFCRGQTLQCCTGKVFAFTCLGSAWLCSGVADGRPMGAQGPCSCSDPSWVCPEPTDWDWLGHVSSGGCGELPRLW